MADKPDELQPETIEDEDLEDVTGGVGTTPPNDNVPGSGPGGFVNC